MNDENANVRGWYAVSCGEVIKIVRLDGEGRDTVHGLLPAGSLVGRLMDFIWDTGSVQDGDLLVLTDGTSIRISTTREARR